MHFITTFLLLNLVWLLYDAFSCVLVIRRQIRGRGASAVPLITLFGYAATAYWAPGFSPAAKVAMLGAGVLAHGLLQFGIPDLHRLLRKRWMDSGGAA